MNWEKIILEDGQTPEFPLNFLAEVDSVEHKYLYFDGSDIQVKSTKEGYVVIPTFKNLNTEKNINEIKNEMIYIAGKEGIKIEPFSMIHFINYKFEHGLAIL